VSGRADAAVRGQFVVREGREAIDVELVHAFLSQQSYWAQGIPRDTLERALDNSLCFGGFVGGRQVAFARVVSDYATFANLVDVFVLPECRGRGYSRQLLDVVMAHPKLQGLRRFMLATRDAHGLYARYEFHAPARPEVLMERHFPGIYTGGADGSG